MKKYTIGLLTATFLLVLTAPSVYAFDCPNLVNRCNALVGKMEKRAGTDKMKLTKAKQGCAEALSLHQAGKHQASVTAAGHAISQASDAGM